MLRESYLAVFRETVHTARDTLGYELPDYIEHYVIALLADRIDRTDWEPEQSFAHALYECQNSRTAKQLGDTCLWLTGVFPTYRQHRGMTRRYYCTIGASAYSSVHTELFDTLSVQFDTVSRFINCAVNGEDTLGIEFTL